MDSGSATWWLFGRGTSDNGLSGLNDNNNGDDDSSGRDNNKEVAKEAINQNITRFPKRILHQWTVGPFERHKSSLGSTTILRKLI